MKGLDISQLISAPLLATATAQQELSRNTVEYIKSFSSDGKVDSLDFSISSEDGDYTIGIPTIALAPIPSMAVEEVSIDFQMEVLSAEKSEDGENISVEGAVSSSSNNTRSSNQSAKYQIHVNAKKQEQSEAFSRVLDIIASGIVAKKNDSETQNQTRIDYSNEVIEEGEVDENNME